MHIILTEDFLVKHFFSSTLIVSTLIYFSNCTDNTYIPFNTQHHQITLQSIGGGSLSIDKKVITVKHGDTVAIAAYSDNSTVFTKWTHGPSIVPLHNLTESIVSFTANGDDTLVAWFGVKKYTVSFSSSNINYGTVTPTSPKQVSHNGTLPITATVKRGCKFTGWTVSGTMGVEDASSSGTSTNVIDVLSGGTVTANFAPITPVSGIVYVDKNANSAGGKNGTNWFNAYTSLAKATSTESAGKTFWVAEGTYTAVDEMNTSGQNPTAFTFDLQNSDKLYGGFMGSENTKDTRDAGMNWKYHETVLSGNIGELGVNTDNTAIIVTGSGTDVVVDGVVVKESRLQLNTGSGVLLKGENSILINSMISDNYGVGIHIEADNCKLLNCVVAENSSPSASAGLYIDGPRSGIIVSNCVFTLNTSVNGGSAIYGGDINAHSRFLNCTIIKNHCTGGGPSGIACNGTDTLLNCILYGNTTTNASSGSQIYYTYFMRNCNVQDLTSTGIGFNGDESNCIDQDPQFKNWNDLSNKNLAWWFSKGSSGLFLKSTSPLNNGDLYTFSGPYDLTDILGAARNTMIDMGAYEYWP